MAGLLEGRALPVHLVTSTTEFEEDVDGGPPWMVLPALDPILCPNRHQFLQNKAWKAVIVPVGFLS
jgi:hypothetical protein